MVEVDLSGMDLMHVEVVGRLKGVPDIMHAMVENAAAEARMHHGYQNRTGNLTKSTRGIFNNHRSLAHAEVLLLADMFYATYVQRRGLMSIREAARMADRAIRAAFARLV